jgi:hypothetical protein
MVFKHLRTQFHGSYFNALLEAEIWTTSVNWILNDSDPDDMGALPNLAVEQTDDTGTAGNYTWRGNWHATRTGIGPNYLGGVDWLKHVSTAFETFFANSETSDQCTYKGVKGYPINDVGKSENYVAEVSLNTPTRGGGTSGMLPPQNSVVASLVTPVLGAHGRGRCYLPGTNRGVIESYGIMTGTTPQGIADHFALCLFNAGIYGLTPWLDNWVVPIVTQAKPINYGRVKSVRVGTIVDTQRRRRNQLTETYSSTNL